MLVHLVYGGGRVPKIDQINYIAMLWRPMVRVLLGRFHQGGRCFSSLAHGFNEKELNQSWLKLATYRINQLLGKNKPDPMEGYVIFI